MKWRTVILNGILDEQSQLMVAGFLFGINFNHNQTKISYKRVVGHLNYVHKCYNNINTHFNLIWTPKSVQKPTNCVPRWHWDTRDPPKCPLNVNCRVILQINYYSTGWMAWRLTILWMADGGDAIAMMMMMMMGSVFNLVAYRLKWPLYPALKWRMQSKRWIIRPKSWATSGNPSTHRPSFNWGPGASVEWPPPL